MNLEPLKSATEYRVIKERIAEFEWALEQADRYPLKPGVDPIVAKAHRDSVESVLADLRGLVRDWEQR